MALPDHIRFYVMYGQTEATARLTCFHPSTYGKARLECE